jgi:hypothetical protein
MGEWAMPAAAAKRTRMQLNTPGYLREGTAQERMRVEERDTSNTSTRQHVEERDTSNGCHVTCAAAAEGHGALRARRSAARVRFPLSCIRPLPRLTHCQPIRSPDSAGGQSRARASGCPEGRLGKGTDRTSAALDASSNTLVPAGSRSSCPTRAGRPIRAPQSSSRACASTLQAARGSHPAPLAGHVSQQ